MVGACVQAPAITRDGLLMSTGNTCLRLWELNPRLTALVLQYQQPAVELGLLVILPNATLTERRRQIASYLGVSIWCMVVALRGGDIFVFDFVCVWGAGGQVPAYVGGRIVLFGLAGRGGFGWKGCLVLFRCLSVCYCLLTACFW